MLLINTLSTRTFVMERLTSSPSQSLSSRHLILDFLVVQFFKKKTIDLAIPISLDVTYQSQGLETAQCPAYEEEN